MRTQAIKVFKRTIFCGEELNLQLRFNLLLTTTHRPPQHLPYKGKRGGEDLDPSQQIGLRWEDRRKMGQDTTCDAAWKTKDKESRHIEAGKKKKIPFNDTNLLDSIQLH